jgi:hypothetical protein
MALEKVMPHGCAEDGFEGIAARLGITAEQYKQRLRADKNARTSRARGTGAATEHANNERIGLRYCP